MIGTFLVPAKKYRCIPGTVFAIVLVLTVSIFQCTNAAAANTLILDNDEAGTSSTGKWRHWGKTDPYGGNSLHTDKRGATYTFNVALPTGEYQVFAWWAKDTNRRTGVSKHRSSVPYDITHPDGTTSTVTVNQQENSGQWNPLGATWYFDTTASITIRSLGNGSTSADAIMLVPVGGNTTVNTAPELGTIGSQSITAENTLSFDISATDSDGTIPLLDATGLPPNAVFVDNNNGTGTFTWPTTSSATGTRDITFNAADANDAMLTDSETITVLVLAANNTPPTISGSPATSVEANSAYSFEPLASDQDGDSLSFSITNRPSWAQFNTSTGRLAGTPGNSDSGATGNIQISVSDATETVSLPAFSITVNGTDTPTGAVTLNWTAPVARTDGSPIAMSEIAGFTVHYGTSEGSHPNRLNVDDGSATSATIADLQLGTYYLVVTTRDDAGRESGDSSEVAKVVN